MKQLTSSDKTIIASHFLSGAIENLSIPLKEQHAYKEICHFKNFLDFSETVLSMPTSSLAGVKVKMEEHIRLGQKVPSDLVNFFINMGKNGMGFVLSELDDVWEHVEDWDFSYLLGKCLARSCNDLNPCQVENLYKQGRVHLWPLMAYLDSFPNSLFEKLVTEEEQTFIDLAQEHDFSSCVLLSQKHPNLSLDITSCFLWQMLTPDDPQQMKSLGKVLAQARKDYGIPTKDVLPPLGILAGFGREQKLSKTLLYLLDILGEGEKIDVSYLQGVFKLNIGYMLEQPKQFCNTLGLFSKYLEKDFPFVFNTTGDEAWEEFDDMLFKGDIVEAVDKIQENSDTLPLAIQGFYYLCEHAHKLPHRFSENTPPSFGGMRQTMEASLLIAYENAFEEKEVIERFFEGYDNLMTKQSLTKAVAKSGVTPSVASSSRKM